MKWTGNGTRLGAAFLLGSATALWLFPVLAGPRVQQLRLERDKALGEVESLRGQVQKLKEAQQKRVGNPLVKRAKAKVEGPDRRVVLEAERRVEKQLAELVGRPIEDVSFLVLYSKLHGRLLTIDGVIYHLDVRSLVIGPEIVLYGVLVPVTGR